MDRASCGGPGDADKLDMPFDTPVAYFIYNRPQQTEQSFKRIAEIEPRTLLLIADGPRGESERQRCDDTRAVLRHIDWECDIHINFSDYNIGCRQRVASGLDWVFQRVEAAIILEDDCVPDATFFAFCEQLLSRYRSERRVSMIAGDNFQFGRRRTAHSYYFSLIPHIWGWATWRRSWRYFDLDMKAWPKLRRTSWLRDTVTPQPVVAFYRDMFDRAHAGEVDTWDIQWVFANFVQGGLTILPQTNLVTNIGFGTDATHTRSPTAREANMRTAAMQFPLQHPPTIQRNVEADEFTFEDQFGLQLNVKKSIAA